MLWQSVYEMEYEEQQKTLAQTQQKPQKESLSASDFRAKLKARRKK